MGTLAVYFPALFALGCVPLLCLVDPSPKEPWPPKLDTSGDQALMVLTSPVFLGVAAPMLVGLVAISKFARHNKIPSEEHASMVWWLANLLWFHTGCDLLSGYFQVMPVLTELYTMMTPAHAYPRWHESRAHLDAGYALELFFEVPFALWALVLYFRRDPARHVFECFALGVQFAGTICYYAPGIAKMEAASWLSWVDRSCGSVWLMYPAFLCYRHMSAARPKNPVSKGRSHGKKKA